MDIPQFSVNLTTNAREALEKEFTREDDER